MTQKTVMCPRFKEILTSTKKFTQQNEYLRLYTKHVQNSRKELNNLYMPLLDDKGLTFLINKSNHPS